MADYLTHDLLGSEVIQSSRGAVHARLTAGSGRAAALTTRWRTGCMRKIQQGFSTPWPAMPWSSPAGNGRSARPI